MDFLDVTLATAAEDVALDEALLLAAEGGAAGEVLRVWERAAPAVVLGSGCKLREDVDAEACEADGVPLIRRSSGGGTVLLGRGCLCYSLVLAYARRQELSEIASSYRWILEQVIESLGLAEVVQEGISDLVIDGRKFSGNAQQRKRHHVLHHGTILYGMDLGLVAKYLRLPERQPEYRGKREHSAFVRNVEVTREDLISRLRRQWGADAERKSWPADEVARLVREKYASAEWTWRR